MNWGYPRTWEGFLHALTRGQYDKTNPTSDLGRFADQMGMLFTGALDEFNLFYLLIGLVPFFFYPRMQKREQAWMQGLVGMYLCLAVLLIVLLNPSVVGVGCPLPFVAAGGGEGAAAGGGGGARGGVSSSLNSISRSSWRRSCDAVRRARPTHLPISAATLGRRWGPKTKRPMMATRSSSPGPMSNIVAPSVRHCGSCSSSFAREIRRLARRSRAASAIPRSACRRRSLPF